MSIDLKSAANNLSGQTKKFQIALYYTDNEDRAKRMLNGSYLDLYLIKGRFSSSNIYGAFIIFLNIPNLRVANIYTAVSRSFELAEIKTNHDWYSFEQRLVEIAKKRDFDDVITSNVNESLLKSLTTEKINELLQSIEHGGGISLNHDFRQFFSDVTGFKNVQFSLDYEKISSLAMELQSITSTKISDVQLKNQKEDVIVEKIDDFDDVSQSKGARHIIKGALILSPVSGKEVSELVVGDRVMISIIDRGDEAIEFLKTFRAYKDDGATKPVIGQIVSINHTTYYKIYAIVAEGVYVKIVEEEGFVKVAMDSTYYDMQNVNYGKESDRNKMILYMLSGFFLILLTLLFFNL